MERELKDKVLRKFFLWENYVDFWLYLIFKVDYSVELILII